jgi:hypothetical protein
MKMTLQIHSFYLNEDVTQGTKTDKPKVAAKPAAKKKRGRTDPMEAILKLSKVLSNEK